MSDTVDRTESVFAAAVALASPGERAALLDQACADDPPLRVRVEALLRAHDRAGHLLDRPPAATSQGTVRHVTPGEQPGTVIAGRYKLLEEIGEGGMGTVWVAEQTAPVRRKVALKLIKLGMDSKSVLARFEAERQALALMDHPNIAKVLDGGLTEASRPYFVMEYVKGVPITEYCDAVRLNVRDRLQLFVQVCQAVQHAHQKGVIHRDLKPSNILVAPYDDRPVPKVIDFGLAKAMHQSLTERTLHTAHETVLGTPLYMSPEQAQLNNLDVDTRSDIYSLGVLLYELLTGTTPLEKRRFKEAAWDEVRRIIREEEPPRPSARLSSTATLPSLAACRQSEPAQLPRLVRGDLDWIVMKALEKDRTRRYESATGLALDVQRYLGGDPVSAHPPSASYKLQKFVRRNRPQVVAASLVLLALVAGIVGTTVGLIRAESQRRIAEQARADEAEQRALAQANEAKALSSAEEERKARLQEAQQRARAEKARDRTRQVLDAMTSSVTEESLTTQTEISEEQRKFLTEVLTYYKEFAGEKADDEQSRARTAASARRVGSIENRLGRLSESAAAYRQAIDGYQKLADDFPAAPEHRHNLARGQTLLADSLRFSYKPAETIELLRRAVATFRRLVDESPASPDYRVSLARAHRDLALFLGGRLVGSAERAGAEEHARQALAIYGKLADEFPTVADHREGLAWSHNALARHLAAIKKTREAVEEQRNSLAILEKLAAEFPSRPRYQYSLAGGHNDLGVTLIEQGKLPEAEEQYRKALPIRQKLAAEYPAEFANRRSLALIHTNLGILLERMGKKPEAVEQYQKALPIWEKLAADFPAQQELRAKLAGSLASIGRIADAVGQAAELTKRDGWGSNDLYNFACIYALASGAFADKKQEYADRAVDLLRKAVKAGFTDARLMAKDPDLASLREREDFKKLLAELTTGEDAREKP
jgi:serine/threonine protein kinase